MRCVTFFPKLFCLSYISYNVWKTDCKSSQIILDAEYLLVLQSKNDEVQGQFRISFTFLFKIASVNTVLFFSRLFI